MNEQFAGNRDTNYPRIEVLSAPTSPIEPLSTNIGRNPLRGSKCKPFNFFNPQSNFSSLSFSIFTFRLIEWGFGNVKTVILTKLPRSVNRYQTLLWITFCMNLFMISFNFFPQAFYDSILSGNQSSHSQTQTDPKSLLEMRLEAKFSQFTKKNHFSFQFSRFNVHFN